MIKLQPTAVTTNPPTTRSITLINVAYPDESKLVSTVRALRKHSRQVNKLLHESTNTIPRLAIQDIRKLVKRTLEKSTYEDAKDLAILVFGPHFCESLVTKIERVTTAKAVIHQFEKLGKDAPLDYWQMVVDNNGII